jgi:hypothetical protein
MGFFCFLGAGDFKIALTFENSVPKLFVLQKMLYEDFYYADSIQSEEFLDGNLKWLFLPYVLLW